MAEKNVSVRLVATGGGQVRAELTQIGATGDQAFDRVGASADSANRKLKVVGDTARSVGRSGSEGFRNLGFQVQDFAVQVGAGTSATQSFAQQFPQLASGFGPLGIAIGTAAAVMVPLVSTLLNAEEGASKFSEAMKEAEGSSGALSKAVAAAKMPLVEMTKLYGESADEVERLNRATLAMTKVSALADLRELAGILGGQAGSADTTRPDGPNMLERMLGSVSGVDQQYMVEMSAAQKAQAALAEKYRLTTDEADRLSQALRAVGKAGTDEAALQASVALLETMVELAGSTENASNKFGGEGGLWDMASDVAEIAKNNVKSLAEEAANATNVFERGVSRLFEMKGVLDSMFPDQGGPVERLSQALSGAGQWYSDLSKSMSNPGTFEARYVAERASGAGSETEELVRAVTATAEQLGISAKDLLAVMSFETGGRLRPDVMGPTTKWGQHFGLIQFGQPQGKKYGVSPESTITEQVIAAGQYLQDAGVKAGDSLANVYAAVLAGDARKVNASDLKAGGVVGNVTEAVGGSQFAAHLAQAEGMLKAYSGVVQQVVGEHRALDAATIKTLDLGADFLVSMDQQVAAAALEAESTGKSVYEQTRLRAEMMLTQQARAKGIDLTDKIAGTERTYGQAISETAAALASSAQNQADREGQMKAAEDAAKRAGDTMSKLRDELQSGFDSAFKSIIDGTKSVGDAFRDMIANMLAERAAAGFGSIVDSVMGAAFGGFGGGDSLSSALAGAGAPVGGAIAQQAVHVTVGVDQKSGNLTAFTDQRVSMGMRQADRAMPGRVGAINRDPLRR